MSTTIAAALPKIDLSLPFFVTGVFYAVGTSAFWAFFRGVSTVPAPAKVPEQA